MSLLKFYLSKLKELVSDESGQAMTEYILLCSLVAAAGLGGMNLIASKYSEAGGIYKSIYWFLKALQINACLPIP